jgi:hypothetical protein
MEAVRGRREFLAGIAGLTTAVASRSVSIASGESVGAPQTDRSPAAVPMFMYVGSFTGKDRGHGEGLSVYHGTASRTRGRWFSS